MRQKVSVEPWRDNNNLLSLSSITPDGMALIDKALCESCRDGEMPPGPRIQVSTPERPWFRVDRRMSSKVKGCR